MQHTSPVHTTHQSSTYNTSVQYIHHTHQSYIAPVQYNIPNQYIHHTTSPVYTTHQPNANTSPVHTSHAYMRAHECRSIVIGGVKDYRQPAHTLDLSVRTTIISNTGIPKPKIFRGTTSHKQRPTGKPYISKPYKLSRTQVYLSYSKTPTALT